MIATYTCPHCGRVSYNPHDLANRYCGACHQFEDEYLIRVTGPNFVAGLLIDSHDRILRAAPIFRRFKSLESFARAAVAYHWKTQYL